MTLSPGSTADVLREAALPFLLMLGSMAVVPAVRPLLAEHGVGEGPMHAFMSVNMLGGAIGAPLVARRADRGRSHATWALRLAVMDAVLIGLCTLNVPVGLLLVVRSLQGATSVGLLSLLLAGAGRSRGAAGTRLGAAGAAMTAGLALGPAIGGFLLTVGPRAPFLLAAALNLVTAVVVSSRAPTMTTTEPRPRAPAAFPRSPALAVPWLMAFTERFTVGCFVVSFAIYAHESLGLSDHGTSLRFTLFIASFAIAMVPMWRLATRVSRALLLGFGGLGYGLAFLLFAIVRGPALDLALVLAGVCSATMYAPSLALAGTLAPPGGRATSMALFNAAGCVGMMLGPAVAGILSAALRAAGHGPDVRYPTIFAVAGLVQIVAMVLLARPIARLRGAELASTSGGLA